MICDIRPEATVMEILKSHKSICLLITWLKQLTTKPTSEENLPHTNKYLKVQLIFYYQN